jgi:hypothetical protein
MMRVPTLAGLALATFAGVAAAGAAQTSSAPASKTPAYAAPVIADADAMKGADQLRQTNLRQQLQDQLSKAGYTSIKVMPSSFFVKAKDKQGNPVEMIIGPDSFAEVTDVTVKTPGPTSQQQAPSTTTQQK